MLEILFSCFGVAAERADLAVLHYDSDFDRLAEITGEPVEWVVTRGSVT